MNERATATEIILEERERESSTDLGKCSHLYYETQGTMKRKLFPKKIVFVRCKTIDNNKRSKQKRRQARS